MQKTLPYSKVVKAKLSRGTQREFSVFAEAHSEKAHALILVFLKLQKISFKNLASILNHSPFTNRLSISTCKIIKNVVVARGSLVFHYVGNNTAYRVFTILFRWRQLVPKYLLWLNGSFERRLWSIFL